MENRLQGQRQEPLHIGERLSRVLAALDEHCEHVLVHTGQNYDYELNQVFFDDLGVRKPDFFLNSAE
ncbi:MAG: hypothetical protein ACOYL7_15765, partial [Caldilinea sp.]